MSVHWRCPDCHDYLGDYQVQKPYCDRCKRHGKMRFSEPSEIATLRAQLADAIAFVRKAGHLPGCGVSVCQHRLPGGLSGHCGGTNDQPQHRHVSFAIYKHDFQPGECTCGHDRIAGSEGEG